MKAIKFLLAVFLLTGFHLKSQTKKEITLEDIWKDYQLYPSYVSGLRSMNDGLNYTTIEYDKSEIRLVKYSYKNANKAVELINSKNINDLKFSDYEFSADETKCLLSTETESIYRYSSKSKYYVYDFTTKKIIPVSNGEKIMYATFSPKGDKIAYVKNNNLYFTDLTSNIDIQITKDGEKNKIINGASDWVYEEELELVRAFEWSPDGNKIAYFRFDESEVKEWLMKKYGNLYPDEVRFKYPKAGEKNSKVSVHIFDLQKNTTIKAEIPYDFEYISRINWTNDSKNLALQTLNRFQNELNVYLFDITTKKGKSIYKETSDTYVEVPKTHFLKLSDQFIISSEKDGYNHLYLYDINGNPINQITKGNWDVTDFYGIDEKTKTVYFQSAEVSPLERHVYKINLDGSGKTKLTQKKGVNEANFSTTFSYFINYHSDANSPYFITLHNNSGKLIEVLEDNKALKEKMDSFNLSPKEFFSIKNKQGMALNAWIIKPKDFDENKKYPVFMFVYGGPGSQTVEDSWGSMNYFWFQYLAAQGYIVVSVDNRGTGARGAYFKKLTHKQLGKYETEDQIAAAEYLASLKYVDGKRIGIFGWSYGGYMSSLCITKGAHIFKMAIAVAPVTNWRFYDSIYTERYMQTPQVNAEGYDNNSPINHVEKLKGKYLLIHGMSDDNVHYQNTAEMTTALIKADKQFTQFSYPNKNHGIYGGNTRYHLYKMMSNFIFENL
ncbi:MAG: S9 family peptidase [Vicingaceae bacterium]